MDLTPLPQFQLKSQVLMGNSVMGFLLSDSDILGNLFQGAITYGETGQYFTPEAVCS